MTWKFKSRLSKNFKIPFLILNKKEIQKYFDEDENLETQIETIFNNSTFEEEVANPIYNLKQFKNKFGGELKWEIVDSKQSQIKKIIKSKSNLIRTLRV
ncbi:hypothetical protein SCLARK_001264 [Spiroplasma clarkii]|nr:hypothetical protein SCLARK_001264 [Spiroplasma clarkii]